MTQFPFWQVFFLLFLFLFFLPFKEVEDPSPEPGQHSCAWPAVVMLLRVFSSLALTHALALICRFVVQ